MTKILVAYLSVLTTKRNFCQRDLLLMLFPELRMWPLSSLSKKTPSSKVGDELRTNLLNVHMTIT